MKTLYVSVWELRHRIDEIFRFSIPVATHIDVYRSLQRSLENVIRSRVEGPIWFQGTEDALKHLLTKVEEAYHGSNQ